MTRPHVNLSIWTQELFDDCKLRLTFHKLFILQTELKYLRINIPVLLNNLFDSILGGHLITPHLQDRQLHAEHFVKPNEISLPVLRLFHRLVQYCY